VSLSPLQQLIQRRLASRQPAIVQDADATEAAVALVLGDAPDAMLIIRRAEREGDPWSGHMGLPGGRREAGDLDLLATAIRETEEEVGLALHHTQLLGQLDDVAPRTRTRPPIFARPFVFAVTGTPSPNPNREVFGAYWVPLSRLTNPANYRSVTLDIAGVTREFPAYFPGEGTIWGMTERVITSLLKTIEYSNL
jgi:8-oxo-dGTP pyrophosphatase MutT (NUDIX family)